MRSALSLKGIRHSRFLRSLLGVTALIHLGAAPSQAETLKERYGTYCQKDQELTDGFNARIKDEISQTLKKMRVLIHSTAKKYGVDPRAIAGSILAEHSMNTGAKDIAENFLVKIGAAPTGVLFGKKFTYGFGQLHFERAKAAELIAARVENRAVRSDQEISNTILTPEGSINYIGALIKQAQDIYKAGGYDISNDAAVTTTLYNIGEVQQRLVRTKRENRTPSPNYFGCFVASHISEIESIIGPAPKVDSSQFEEASTTQSPARSAKLDAVKSKNEKPSAASSVKLSSTVDRFVASREIKLSNGPKDCYDDSIFPIENRPLAKGTELKIIGKSVDCDLKPWVLVRSSNGTSGWIDRPTLQNSSTKVTYAVESCTLKRPDNCKLKLQNSYKSFMRDEKPNGELTFSLKSTSTNQDFESYDDTEILKKFQLSEADQKRRSAYQSLKQLDENEVLELEKAIDQFKERVRSTLGLKNFKDTSNPYQAFDRQPLASHIDTLQAYKKMGMTFATYHKLTGESLICNPEALINFLKTVPIPPQPTRAELEAVIRPETSNPTLQVFANSDQLDLALTTLSPAEKNRDFFKTMKTCESQFAKYPKIYTQFLSTRSSLMKTLTSGADRTAIESIIYKLNSLKLASKLSQTCQSLQFLDQPLTQLKASGDCDLTLIDTAAEVTQSIKVPLSTAREILKSQDSREAMLFAALNPITELVPVDAISNKDATDGGAEISTLRQLAAALSSESCVQSVYVPEPWLATEGKTTYRPNKTNTISIDYAVETCGISTGAK